LSQSFYERYLMNQRKIPAPMRKADLTAKHATTAAEQSILSALPSHVMASHIATRADGGTLLSARYLAAVPIACNKFLVVDNTHDPLPATGLPRPVNTGRTAINDLRKERL
jgi:hypothetical protein